MTPEEVVRVLEEIKNEWISETEKGNKIKREALTQAIALIQEGEKLKASLHKNKEPNPNKEVKEIALNIIQDIVSILDGGAFARKITTEQVVSKQAEKILSWHNNQIAKLQDLITKERG
jgi:ribonuclease D